MREPEVERPHLDRELIERFLARDRAAGNELYERLRPELLELARSWRARITAIDPEDLVHETFLKVLLHTDRFDPSCDLRPYIFTILKNLALDRARRPSREVDLSNRLCLIESNQSDDPAEQVQGKDAHDHQQAALNDCIAGLTEESRALLYRWRALRGHRCVAKLARSLSQPPSTVDGRLKRVLAQLRRCLISKGITDADESV